MGEILLQAKSEGIEYVIFGDIFLEDLRTYRENNLAKIGMKAIFPLWKMDTSKLIRDFVKRSFETVLCCINDGYLGEEWVGRKIDPAFIEQLPVNVDPCGENGEYHTYCYAGPIFHKSITIKAGEKVYRPLQIRTADDSVCSSNIITKGFWFIDLQI